MSISILKIAITLSKIIVLLLIQTKSHAEIINSFDLMPYETNVSMGEINLNGFTNKNSNTKSLQKKINTVENKSGSSYTIGYISSGNEKIGFTSKVSNYKNLRLQLSKQTYALN